jgi:hypothetical protein
MLPVRVVAASPSGEYVRLGQATHALFRMLPVRGLYVARGQGVHAPTPLMVL